MRGAGRGREGNTGNGAESLSNEKLLLYYGRVNAQSLGGPLILVGAVVLMVGVLVVMFGRIPLLGRLPGDLLFRRDGLKVYVPLATMLLLSGALTIVGIVVWRLFR